VNIIQLHKGKRLGILEQYVDMTVSVIWSWLLELMITNWYSFGCIPVTQRNGMVHTQWQ
jgi:hypothetical protein